MEVGVVWEVVNMGCTICKHQWVATLETYAIYWDKYTEYGYVREAECPECHYMNEVKRECNE